MNNIYGLDTDTLLKYYELGMERETLRVTRDGFPSTKPHPFGNDSRYERDFCESQLEIITGVSDSVDGLVNEMRCLHKHAEEILKPLDEIMWCMSNPPYVPRDKNILIAEFKGEKAVKTEYRKYLAKKYGKRKMLYSGIHLNYSIPKDILKQGFENSKIYFGDFKNYKNSLYLTLAKKSTEIAWLIVELTAASPVMDSSFFSFEDYGETVYPKYSSYRCSENGYWNDFTPYLNYRSIEDYTDSIKSLVSLGALWSESELYIPVRIKCKGENSIKRLRNDGANHIELRMLDLNPLSDIYIKQEDIYFVCILMCYLLMQENHVSGSSPAGEQITAALNEKSAAMFDDKKSFIKQNFGSNISERITVREAAENYLDDMSDFFADSKYALDIINYQKNKLRNGNRYADIIFEKYKNNYVKKILDKYFRE